MKHYKLNNNVYAFEADGSQDDLITSDMTLMTNDEVDIYINPDKYLTPEQKQEQYLQTLKPLTRRQFKLALLEAGLTNAVEQAIANIEDPKLQAVLNIEYIEATEFNRTSASVVYICNLLNLTDHEINKIWEQALTI